MLRDRPQKMRKIRDRLTRGDPVDLRPVEGERVDASDGRTWAPDRTVDAATLTELLTARAGGDRWTHRPLVLAGAHITGALDLQAASITRPLRLEDCYLDSRIVLNDAEAISIRLAGCHLPGIYARGLHTRGDLRLTKGFTANGEVQLIGAHIGGDLDCGGGTFSFTRGDKDRVALKGDGLIVDGSMYCRKGEAATGDRRFAATGEVRLPGAHIGGALSCDHGTFTNREGVALKGDGLIVDGPMYCRGNFAAYGEIRLHNARIGRQLVFGPLKVADKLIPRHIRGNTIHFGPVAGAERLNCSYDDGTTIHFAPFKVADECILSNERGNAIDLEHAKVEDAAIVRPSQLTGGVCLSFAKVGGWYDSDTTWPNERELRLRGFTYNAIAADPEITARQRLKWLSRDTEGFIPQPYEQLATVYRSEGAEDNARAVQIRAQRLRRAAPRTRGSRRDFGRPYRRAWSTLLRATIGYGYRPWQILVPTAILFCFGWIWFSQTETGGIATVHNLPKQVHFHGARYAADLLIPGATLGDRSRFIAVGANSWVAAMYTLVGWALAAMLIAGLTGVFKRQ